LILFNRTKKEKKNKSYVESIGDLSRKLFFGSFSLVRSNKFEKKRETLRDQLEFTVEKKKLVSLDLLFWDEIGLEISLFKIKANGMKFLFFSLHVL
jgi:hypothetical protein